MKPNRRTADIFVRVGFGYNEAFNLLYLGLKYKKKRDVMEAAIDALIGSLSNTITDQPEIDVVNMAIESISSQRAGDTSAPSKSEKNRLAKREKRLGGIK